MFVWAEQHAQSKRVGGRHGRLVCSFSTDGGFGHQAPFAVQYRDFNEAEQVNFGNTLGVIDEPLQFPRFGSPMIWALGSMQNLRSNYELQRPRNEPSTDLRRSSLQ